MASRSDLLFTRTQRAGRTLGLLALAASTLMACGGWPTFDRSTLPAADRWPEVDRVVLLDDVHVRFHRLPGASDPVADVTRHRRVWLRTARAVESSEVIVWHQAGLRDLIAFEGRVIDLDGTEQAFGMADAFDRPAFGRSTLFSDSRAMTYRPEVVPGAVLETRSIVRYQNMRLSSFGHAFAGRDPSLGHRLVVDVPAGWDVRWLAREDDADIEWAPTEAPGPEGGRRLTWQRGESAPAPRERNAPSLWAMMPSVVVQLTRWQIGGETVEGPADPAAVSALLFDLQAPRRVPDAAIEARVAELLEGVGPDPTDRAAALHAFVRDRIRYVSVQLGMGGWIPHPADEVIATGQGDCKAQSALLGAMLTAAGIPNRTATVFAHDGWPKRYGLPTISGNSNHQVVLVDLPGRTVVADPTRPDVPFGEVPVELQAADLLPLQAAGAEIMRMPRAPASANRRVLELDYVVRANGAVRGTVKVDARGGAARPVRALMRSEQDKSMRGRLDDRIGLRYAGIGPLTTRKGIEPGVEGQPLEIEAPAWRTRGLGAADRVWTLSPDQLVSTSTRRVDSGPRTRPIGLGAPRERRVMARLALPAARSVGELPPPTTIETDFARYTLMWGLDGSSLTLERQLTYVMPWLPAARADDYRAFSDAVARADARAVVLRPTGSK